MRFGGNYVKQDMVCFGGLDPGESIQRGRHVLMDNVLRSAVVQGIVWGIGVPRDSFERQNG